MTLQEYKDVLAWTYKNLKGLDLEIFLHSIAMRDYAKPSMQRFYTYNNNFTNKIKEDINKILKVEYVYEIEYKEGSTLLLLCQRRIPNFGYV